MVEAGNAPTTVAAVPGADEVVVLNVLSNDATVLRTDGTTLTSRTIPGIVAGANRLVVSPLGRFAIAWVDGRQLAKARATEGFQTLTVLDLGASDPSAAHTTLAVGAERTRLGPTVALAAFRPRDSVDTLLARTVDQRMVAAE